MIDWCLFFAITVFVFIGEFSSEVLIMVLVHFCKKSQLAKDKEKEIDEIKGKMDKISMVDEFAKYARLQRKLNGLVEELKVESNESQELFRSMKYILCFSLDLFWNTVCSFIIWNNLSNPVLKFDSSWFTPFNSLIGWPSVTSGEVGILFWYIIVKNVVKNIHVK